MSLNDDDSIFEQALKGDLPSADEQARLRKRLLAAGVSFGSSLAATSTASAQVGWGATMVAKVAALSWPVTLVLGAAVATPIVALPIWLAPSKATPVASNQVPVRHASSAVPVGVAAPSVIELENARTPGDEPISDAAARPARPARHAASSGVVAAVHAPEPSSTGASAQPAVSAIAAPQSADSVESVRRATTLAAETRLLDQAFAEIRAGHRANAEALILEHQDRFPNGLLSQERERARARLDQNSKGE